MKLEFNSSVARDEGENVKSVMERILTQTELTLIKFSVVKKMKKKSGHNANKYCTNFHTVAILLELL